MPNKQSDEGPWSRNWGLQVVLVMACGLLLAVLGWFAAGNLNLFAALPPALSYGLIATG